MILRKLLAACLFYGIAAALSAQQHVAPPPQPSVDAPANAAVLKLLEVGMPESVVLDKIHAITDKFDTSVDALVALKQAGATEAELKAVMAQGKAPTDTSLNGASVSSGPSLADTMRYIQDKLNNIGRIEYIVTFQYARARSSLTSAQRSDEISSVIPDTDQCHITYHLKSEVDGKTRKDENSEFSLRNVQDILVQPEETHLIEWYAKHNPYWIPASTSPAVTSLVVRLPHAEENFFLFTDAGLANRVAKAMRHAVELCGGGNKEKF